MSATTQPTFCPHGAFDAGGVSALRPAIEALAATAARQVVIDLSKVTSIDGSGIGAIAFLFKRLVSRGRSVVLTGAHGQPLQVLRDLGLDHVLGVAERRTVPRRGWLSWLPRLAPANGNA